MEKTITILYTAQTPEPFSTLAEYAIKSGAIVTINPEKRTVLAEAPTSKADGSDDDPLIFLRTAIENEALDVIADHAPENNLLKEIAELNKKNADLTESRDRYQKWYSEESLKNSRITKQIDAIAVIMDAIGK